MSPSFTFSTFKTQLLEWKTVQVGTHAGPAQHPASTKAADTDENHLITNCSSHQSCQPRAFRYLCKRGLFSALCNLGAPLNSHSTAERGLKKQI